MARPTIISLYTGAGGLDYGFEAAGFDTRVAVELDHDCCETLRQSRGWTVIERSIYEVPSEEILEAGKLKPGEASLVIGGPPCQPFSKAGYWARGDAGRLDDPRAGTLPAFMRVVEETLPQAFVLENVEGLAYTGKDEGLEFLLERIRKINRRTGSNYLPFFRVMNAAEFGVPQVRARFILVASREGTSFQFPEPRFSAVPDSPGLSSDDELPPYRTAWDALADVKPDPDEDLEVRGKWAGLLPSIPEGENYLWHTDRGGGLPLFGWRRRYWTFLLKLAKNRPSWTIQAQPGPAVGPFHWENRRLSAKELCRLQTFPDDVVLAGGRTSIQRQLGNAVPSLLAEVLGREIRKQLLGLRQLGGPLRLLPPDRSPAPAPEPVAEVPKEYRSLIGNHKPHPGTGLGNRAVERPRSTAR